MSFREFSDRRGHWLVSLYPSDAVRDLGGWSIRAASGVCSADSSIVEVGPQSVCRMVNNLNMAIPDAGSPVQTTIRIGKTSARVIRAVRVFLDIDHPYRGDLIVTLTGPDGSGSVLHNGGGAGTDDLFGWYPTEVTPVTSLNTFNGGSAEGAWTLEVSDMGVGDVGTILGWGLEILFTGETVQFPPLLLNALELTQSFDLGAKSVRLSMQWPDLPPEVTPDLVRLESGYGEIAWVDETADGRGVEQVWEQREIWIEGTLQDLAFGRSDEPFEITLVQEDVLDGGSIYPGNAALDSERHADLGSTADSSRAKNSNKTYPPIPICGDDDGLDLRTPLLCIQDEVNATYGGADLTFRRFLVTYEELANPAVTKRFYLLDGNQRLRTLNLGAALEGVDLLEEPFFYVDGSTQVETTASITFTSGSTTVTGRGVSGLAEGDQIKASGVPNTGYLPIATLDGYTADLSTTYGAASGTSTASLVRRPDDQAYCAYYSLAGAGGIRGTGNFGVDPTRPMDNPIDFIEWLLRRSRLNLKVDYASLRNIREQMASWYVTTVINEDRAPWDYIRDKLLPWLPVRPYVHQGFLRFAYDGPVPSTAAVTSIDLTDRTAGIARKELISLSEIQEVFNEIHLRFAWDVYRGRFYGDLTVGGRDYYRGTLSHLAQFGFAARGAGSQYEYAQRTSKGQQFPAVRRLDLDVDTICDHYTAELAANHLLWRYSARRFAMSLDASNAWRWLEVGEVVSVSETDVLPGAGLWRIVEATRSSLGSSRFNLESL